MSGTDTSGEFERGAETAARQEREIQAGVDREERSFDPGKGEESKGAMQAGARRYPEPPFPEQHQVKPGDEAALNPAPMYDAPFYKG